MGFSIVCQGLGSLASSAGILQEFNKVVISMTSRPCWHQWQFHQQSPPLSLMTTTHAPPMSMLSFCLHLSLCLLSPFGINGKGCPHTCLWNLWSLLTTPPVNMHNPRTCLYAWSSYFLLWVHSLASWTQGVLRSLRDLTLGLPYGIHTCYDQPLLSVTA